jgi:FkbM family methyltransferase
LAPLLAYCSGPGTQEDGIIHHLLVNLSDFSPYAVEFGQRHLGGGTMGNIARARQFSLLNLDIEASKEREVINPWADEKTWTLVKTKVSPLNLNLLFDENGVPENPAAVVVDVGGMDYWCTLALLQKRRPALLIVEYNCHIAPDVSSSLVFNPEHTYQKNKNYGASLSAFTNILSSKGYRLIHIHGPLNLYFVDESKLINTENFRFSENLTNLSSDALAQIADTQTFCDSFHSGGRPSWFHTPAPDPKAAPWIELDRIGESTQSIKIDDISLDVFSKDKGGDHYKQRGHKEDSVSPLWRLIKEKLKPYTLIDIGANYGYTASLLAKRLEVSKVIAVEPDPRLAGILNTNLRSNLTDIKFQIIEATVSSKPAKLSTLGINPFSTQDNRLLAQKSWSEVVVHSVSLDDLIGQVENGKPFFIKCDTQGFDLDVLESGWKQLNSRFDWMMRFEFGPYWIENQGFNSHENFEKICRSFHVFEAPLRTPWIATFGDIFSHPIKAHDSTKFLEYVRKLNHNGMGWVDLYLLPFQSPLIESFQN